MDIEQTVSRHYGIGGIHDRIMAALGAAGVDTARATPDDLKPVDEFHIGGAAATKELVGQIALASGMQVLDIGSGVGGTSRLVATETGASVAGIDLTPEYVETAKVLSRMVGLDGRTRFVAGSALELPFDSGSFDAALLIHVGMNIPDKARLMAEAARVLKPGAPFAIYDVMLTGPGDPSFPVPWAVTPDSSFLATPGDYRAAAEAAGFSMAASRERRQFALDFFERMQARMAEQGPPALGIHLLMGETASTKIANMVANIRAGYYAPVEMILRNGGG